MAYTPRHQADYQPWQDSACPPYPFSNDDWSPTTVADLRVALALQNTSREKAAGLVIGSGGLPYILAHVGVSRLVVADLHEEVIETTLWRVGRLNDHADWDGYEAEVTSGLQDEGDRHQFGLELNRARKGGLLDDFSVTRAGLATTELVGAQGDICQIAPALGEQIEGDGQQVTFVNTTNVITYTGDHAFFSRSERRRILGNALGHLPLAESAIIIDSAPRLIPKIYLAETYPGVRQETS
ncbi:MAG TPA: hypothetical protein VGF75_07335 [Candidatus Saccharimonadales bacterium]|jgi:hypothetical protein